MSMRHHELPEIDYDKIACQQILEADHSVFSIQTVVIPHVQTTQLTSERLLQLYLAYIERFTLGLIKAIKVINGLDFHLAGTRLALITFSPPVKETSDTLEKTTLHISGGFLVQRQECDRGQLDFLIETVDSGSRVTLQLSDFCPLILGSNRPSLWRKWLYRLTQAYIHKIVTIRFLAMVYRKITGEKVQKGVVRIVVRSGKDT